MANPDVVKYVSEQLQKGIALSLVVGKLRAAGWKEKDINEAVASLGTSSQSSSASPAEEIGLIRSQLHSLEARLNNLESRLGGTTVSEPSAQFQPSYGQPISRPETFPSAVSADLQHEIGSSYSGVTSAGGAGQLGYQEPERLESRITGKWFAAVGIIALVFGVGFLLKYAFENNIIGETGRVIMGIVGGLAMLGLGDFLSRKEKYRTYSFFLSGGGLAILYLSIYGAFNYYHLISLVPAFAFMVVITLIGAILAIKQDSPVLAGLSLAGGFMTPFLVSSGENNHFALLSYLAILNLTYLLISYFKKWHKVYFLNFLGTYAVFYSWMAQFYDKDLLGPTMFFLTIYFLIFLLAPFFMSLARKIKSEDTDILSAALNAMAYFITAYFLLKPDFEAYLGFFFAGWAAVYILGAYILAMVNSEDKSGILGLGGVGLVLATAAVPIQLSSIWITITWSVEALILTWIGLSLKSKNIRTFAYIVFGLVLIRLFVFDTRETESIQYFVAFFNQRFMTFLVAVVSMFGATGLLAASREELSESESNAPAAMGIIANLLAVSALSMEVGQIFEKKIYNLSQATHRPSIFDNSEGRYDYGQIESIRNQKNLSLSVLWGAYAGLLMLVGFMKKIRSIRILGIAGMLFVILKVFLFDMQQLSELYRIISFIVLGIILLTISFLYYLFREKIKELVL